MIRTNATHLPIQWRFGLIIGLAMTVVALVPQFHLGIVRSSDWQGAFVSFDFDEVAYASYLNALIDGRPRRNDPYTGRDDTAQQPLPESLHSIQFVPAYALALPSRAFGLSAATTFILVRAFAAFASALALFWLLTLITSDSRLAAGATIVLLCLGSVAADPHNAWRLISLRGRTDSLPFLRVYVPALVYPLFFIFMGLIWQSLLKKTKSTRVRTAGFAGLLLVVLIFSYFFLWTAAIAWFVVIVVLWLFANRLRDRDVLVVFAIPTVLTAAALIPYSLLLNRRAPTVDAAQLLTHTRSPLLSFSVVIGLLVLLALVIVIKVRKLPWREPAVLFTASLALLPAVCFNQQLVTGLLLQPVHYSRYVSNYASMMAAFLAGVIIFRSFRKGGIAKGLLSRVLFFVVLTVFGWAIVEAAVRSRRLINRSSSRDEARRVALRLRELAAEGTAETKAPVVFCSDVTLSDSLPNTAPQPVLWSSHLFVFSGASALENRHRLYQQLYYSGFGEEEFADLAGQSSFLQLALFGWERMSDEAYAKAITRQDVQHETNLYSEYVRDFDVRKATQPMLVYVVVPARGGPSLENLDRWYVRDAGQPVGDYLLYQVRLR